MSMNSIMIFNATTSQVITWWEQEYGAPIPERYADWNAATMDYRIALQNYEDDDFDADGTITDAACAAYGISTAHKTKVSQDQYIAAASELYAFQPTTLTSTLAAPALSAQRKSLVVTLVNAHIDAGGGPGGMDAIPSNFYRYWQRNRTDPDASTGAVVVTVTKLLADGTTDATATDAITLTVNGGVAGAYTASMVAGATAFGWQPGIEQGAVVFSASSDQSDTDGGAKQLYVDVPDATLGHLNVTYARTVNLFLPGTLSATGGPGGTGVYARIYVPTTPKDTSRSVYRPNFNRVTMSAAGSGPTGGALTLEFEGVTSGKVHAVSMADGDSYHTVDPNVGVVTYFTPGEWITVKVTAANGASDINVQIDWE